MAYYATVIDGPRVDFLAGPFNTHGAALAAVEPARKVIQALVPESVWYGFGTVRDRVGRRRVGKVNHLIDLPEDKLP